MVREEAQRDKLRTRAGKKRTIENIEYLNRKRKHGNMCGRDVLEEMRRKKVGKRMW